MKRLPIVIILVVLVAALGAGWYLKQSHSNSQANSSGAGPTLSPKPTPTNIEPGAEPAHIRGGANAKVTLEEFGDFECPPCGALYPLLKLLEAEYGVRLKVIFREFPLVPTHEHALAAARAAEAAGLQGKFWEMHDLLYENQQTWHAAFDVRPIFEGYAGGIGLDIERYKQDLAGEVVERRIFFDGKRGHSLNVTGTPTVFLNGEEVPFESLQADKLRARINAALEGHKAP
jgi:protein-disulfide isomerase